jgi:hypothetical protein
MDIGAKAGPDRNEYQKYVDDEHRFVKITARSSK